MTFALLERGDKMTIVTRFKIKFFLLMIQELDWQKLKVWSSMRKKFTDQGNWRKMPLLLTSAHIHTLQATQLNFFVDHQKKELVRPVLLDKLLCIALRLVFLLTQI